MSDKFVFTDPRKIANEAERMYRETLQEKLELPNEGQYVAIDVLTGHHYLGKYAALVLVEARKKAPLGVFHLIKIGGSISLGARYIGRQQSDWDWTLRRRG